MITKEKMIKARNIAVGALTSLVTAPVFAETDVIGSGISKATTWVKLGALFLVAMAAMAGVWFAITGTMGMINKDKSQATAGQNLGKVLGGIFLVGLMAFIAIFMSDLGVTSNAGQGAGMNSVFSN